MRAACLLLVTVSLQASSRSSAIVDLKNGRVISAERPFVRARPGSTIKPLALQALIESGKLSPKERFVCPGLLRIGDRNLTCSHAKISHPIDIESAIAYSCNNFVAHFAERFSDGQLGQFLRKKGLHAADAVGVVQRQLQALGETGVDATPVELAEAYRSLSDSMAPAIAEGLRGAVTYGTARLAVGFLGGKTGTTDGRSWFSGFTRDVAVAVLTGGGSGGTDAAPAASELLHPEATVRVRRSGPGAPRLVSMPLERYVAEVLARECGNFRSEESRKAMAVAVRTYALRFRGKHGKEGFDFCDTTHCQAMSQGNPDARSVAAAEATRGELLWFEGVPARSYYFQNCAGATEAGVNLWPDVGAPYLKQQADPYCTRNGRMEWQFAATAEAIEEALRAAGLNTPERLRHVRIVRKTPSGRARQLQLSGAGAPVLLTATSFRFAIGRSLGWGSLRSDWYEVKDSASMVSFHGWGGGHGVGLCQMGAEQMGIAGKSYRQILAQYYPGTSVSSSAQGLAWERLGGERVDIWTTQAAHDQQYVSLADRVLRQVEQQTAWRLDRRPQLRIFPTMASFRNGTAESGLVTADSRGALVRLQPFPKRETFRHELTHLLIESHVRASLPLWFREDATAYLCGEPAPRLLGQSQAQVLQWIQTGLPASARLAVVSPIKATQAVMNRR